MKGSKKNKHNQKAAASSSTKKKGDTMAVVKEKRRTFDESFALLTEFKKRKGHCNVPKRFSEDPRLGNFVNHQKEEYKKFRDGKPTAMTKERIEKLESIGFNWGGTKSQEQGYDDQWNAKYGELEAYKEEHGDCLVPHNYENQALYNWSQMQRQRKKQHDENKMTVATRPGRRDNVKVWEERFDKLKTLGFIFDAREEQWQQNAKRLAIYRQAFGHVDIGNGTAVALDDDGSLAQWAQMQKAQYWAKREGKKSSMTDERIKQLEDLGFKWSIKTRPGDEESGGNAVDCAAQPAKKPSKQKPRSAKSGTKAGSSSTRVSTRSSTARVKEGPTRASSRSSTSRVKEGPKNKKIAGSSKTKKVKVRRDPVTNKILLDRSRSVNNRANRMS